MDCAFSSFLTSTVNKKNKPLKVIESSKTDQLLHTLPLAHRENEKKTCINVKRTPLSFTLYSEKLRKLCHPPAHGQDLRNYVNPCTSQCFLLRQSGPFLCLWHSTATDAASFATNQLIK